ncbi:MAG TPA: gliding motility-associated C-terminal domain-containing protein [Chryseosolibacter sp.]
MIDRRHRILSNYIFRSLILLVVVPGCQQISAAQGLFNASSIFIDGADVFVAGDVTNEGTLSNNGTIAFSGDWKSRGPYSGTGVLKATGSKSQRISHFNQDVHTLIVQGWGTKYIRGEMNITNELHLIEGIVEVSSGDELRLAGAAVIFGGSSDSYVDGPLTQEGTGYKFFPLGKNGTYAPIEYLDVRGEGSEYSVAFFDHAPGVQVEDAIVRKGLCWMRTDRRGNFGGSAVSVDYGQVFSEGPEKMIMLTGTGWDDPFLIISDVHQSPETNKLSTTIDIHAPIIMLGEISTLWNGSDFYFPNALSPNAVNVENRKAKIFGERLSADNFHFTVFNRWGAVVYETSSLDSMKDNGWDGISQGGEQLLAGAYPYKLTGLDKFGKKFEKKGIITIVY